MNELKPCPFCGGQAEVTRADCTDHSDGSSWTVWGVFCIDDLHAEYSHGHFIDNYETRGEAVAAWNRRTR